MLTTVEDLRKGDVVLIGTQGGTITEIKLLRQPQRATTGKTTTWYGTPRWKSVLCAMRVETITRSYTNYRGQQATHTNKKNGVANGQDYNTEKRFDLTDKDCWLIKRENNG